MAIEEFDRTAEKRFEGTMAADGVVMGKPTTSCIAYCMGWTFDGQKFCFTKPRKIRRFRFTEEIYKWNGN